MKIDAEAVYAAVRAIPAGTVITYGDLAEQVGLTSNHARAVGNVLRRRPDRNAWMTTPSQGLDIPWWRVVKADGTLLAEEDEDDYSRQWVEWAKSVLVEEGIRFTDDGRIASLPSAGRSHGSGAGGHSTKRSTRTPEPCWRHDTIQYTCRDCVPTY